MRRSRKQEQFLQRAKLLFAEAGLFKNLAKGSGLAAYRDALRRKFAFHRDGEELCGSHSVLLLRIRRESIVRGPHGRSKASGIST